MTKRDFRLLIARITLTAPMSKKPGSPKPVIAGTRDQRRLAVSPAR
jgi:hypothetical protein